MTKREQNTGKHGEQVARSILSGLGLEMIERVGTPVNLVPVKSAHLRNAYFVIFGEKVAADFRALLPNGTSVLIEVKTILDRNLTWSDLREHQPAKLNQHANLHGLSLIVWIHDSGQYVMRWPVAGFGPGKGIDPRKAQAVHEETVEFIRDYIQNHKEGSHVSNNL